MDSPAVSVLSFSQVSDVLGSDDDYDFSSCEEGQKDCHSESRVLYNELKKSLLEKDCPREEEGGLCRHLTQLIEAREKIARLERQLARERQHNELMQKGGDNMLKCLEQGFREVGIDLSKLPEHQPGHRENWLEALADDGDEEKSEVILN